MVANPEIKFTRVLVEVVGIDYGVGDIHEEASVRVVLPSWNLGQEFAFPVTHVNDWNLRELKPGDRLLAEANLAAETSDELLMKDFEKAPPPTEHI
ncbi:MAG: hypothetical protein G01um101493_383 [Microgenomates group bacterium Gr01-1014_93]|nr:MAG: hypothetical protein G01um101493_383 [Microgenomates group bacterium Gr01-1014_93]